MENDTGEDDDIRRESAALGFGTGLLFDPKLDCRECEGWNMTLDRLLEPEAGLSSNGIRPGILADV